MKRGRSFWLGCCLVFLQLSSQASFFTVSKNQLDLPTHETVEAAWAAAQGTVGVDDLITILDSSTYTLPNQQLDLINGQGCVILTVAPGRTPVLDQPNATQIFRNLSSAGETLTLEGAGAAQRLTLRRTTTGAQTIVNCGAATGNGPIVLRNLILEHDTGTPGAGFFQLINNATHHTVENVACIGSQSANMALIGSFQLGLDTPIKPTVSITNLDVHEATAGSGPDTSQIFLLRHPVNLEVKSSRLEPLGSCSIVANTLHPAPSLGGAPAGDSMVVFRDCSYSSGDSRAFWNLGDPAYASNHYYLYRPVIAGKMGDIAISVNAGSTAAFHVFGSNDDGSARLPKTDLSLLQEKGTAIFARLLAGSLELRDLTSDNSTATIDSSFDGPLTGNVQLNMIRCLWNNAGLVSLYPCDRLDYSWAPSAYATHVNAVNTLWRGYTSNPAWILTNGAHTQPGTISLLHCTLLGDTNQGFIEGRSNDTLTLDGCLVSGGNGSGAFSNIGGSGSVPNLFYWQNTLTLAYDEGISFSGPPNTIANPVVDLYGQPGAVSPALGLASGSTVLEDLTGAPRPLPCGSTPDAGAYETDFISPTASVALETSSPTNDDTVVFNVHFDECVLGFDNADFFDSANADLTAGKISGSFNYTGALISGGPQDFVVTYTGVSGDGTFDLQVKNEIEGGAVHDFSGNLISDSTTSSVLTIDNTPPLVTLKNPSLQTIQCGGGAYVEPGANWTDTVDVWGGDDVIVAGDTVDNSPGTRGELYTITYAKTDTAGNTGAAERLMLVIDTAGPVITIDGGISEFKTECGAPVSLPEALALDDCEGNVSAMVKDLDGLDINHPAVGEYPVTYESKDSMGNTGAAHLTLIVEDNTPPVLNNVPEEVVAVNSAMPFTLQQALDGVSATDNCGISADPAQAISVTLLIGGEPQPLLSLEDPGGPYPKTYVMTYTATDTNGKKSSVDSTLIVSDNNPPVITLKGDNPANIHCPNDWVDGGYSCSDLESGNLDSMVTVVSNVVVELPGVYQVTYDVKDPITNLPAHAHRTVNVLDSPAPDIILSGSSEITIECGAAYNRPDAIASDLCHGDLSGGITVTNLPDIHEPGTYNVTYHLIDGIHNILPAVQVVHVEDTMPPTLSLEGPTETTVECHSSFSDPGALALDDCDLDISGKVQRNGALNINQPGDYLLQYTVMDAGGRAATPVQRTVHVIDTQAPQVQLPAPNPLYVSMDENYTLPVVSAQDACSGVLVTEIIDNDGFMADIQGEYHVVYQSAPDNNGLTGEATLVVRVVEPLDVLSASETSILAEPGDRVEMRVVVVNGVGEVTYNWKKEKINKELMTIKAGTGSVLVLNAVSDADVGNYFCEVTDKTTDFIDQSPTFELILDIKVPTAGIIGLVLLGLATGVIGCRRLADRRTASCCTASCCTYRDI